MTQLQRLVIEFKAEELVLRALYKTDDAAKLGQKTKARTREVTELARSGLRDALEALRSYMRAGRAEALRMRRGAA